RSGKVYRSEGLGRPGWGEPDRERGVWHPLRREYHSSYAGMHQLRWGETRPADEPRNRSDCALRRPASRRTRRKGAMNRPPHLLLVEAPYYTHIAEHLRKGAERAMAAAGATHAVISVPGAFEIPAAIGIVARSTGRFDGFVALGCVIRGETTHYDHICAESARGLQELGSRDGLAVGFGILTCENEAQALVRASPEGRDQGGRAVNACLALVALKRRFPGNGR